MIYVSLPVHTQPVVIASQLRNFARFFPEATVVLHVSETARFTIPTLTDALHAVPVKNVVINPGRVPTGWGNILRAHLANIAYIRLRGDATRICLHASNDMLVREGVAAWLNAGHNFCNRRLVHPGTLWRFGEAALADGCLSRLRRRMGAVDVIASQIEGSSYEAPLMFEIADIIGAEPLTPAVLPYPREEVWFSTLAHALQAQIDGKPYVFSELHRFDRVYWQFQRHIDPFIGRSSRRSAFIRRLMEYALIKTGFHRIDRVWVDRVANDDVRRLTPYQTLDDGNNVWLIFDRHGLFGVKRVPRRAGAAVRLYIDALGEALPALPCAYPPRHQPAHQLSN